MKLDVAALVEQIRDECVGVYDDDFLDAEAERIITEAIAQAYDDHPVPADGKPTRTNACGQCDQRTIDGGPGSCMVCSAVPVGDPSMGYILKYEGNVIVSDRCPMHKPWIGEGKTMNCCPFKMAPAIDASDPKLPDAVVQQVAQANKRLDRLRHAQSLYTGLSSDCLLPPMLMVGCGMAGEHPCMGCNMDREKCHGYPHLDDLTPEERVTALAAWRNRAVGGFARYTVHDLECDK